MICFQEEPMLGVMAVAALLYILTIVLTRRVH